MNTDPPTVADLTGQIEDLKHQSGTILYLSAINLIANILTILVAFLAAT